MPSTLQAQGPSCTPHAPVALVPRGARSARTSSQQNGERGRARGACVGDTVGEGQGV